jgi:hypothetical protein
MDKSKFAGIPQVYYFNSDSDIYLREYTEQNLKNIEIISEISLCASIIKTIKTWLETTNESMMVIMFDNIDYQYIKYFDFDWEYLMNNIPHDWDSILLGFEDLLGIIPCFLHPIRGSHGTGPTLINRKYAEKLVKLHFYDNKYNFFRKISNNFWKNDLNFVSYNYFLNQCGASYALPLLPKNSALATDRYFSKDNLNLTKHLYSVFWKKVKQNITTEKFFSYTGVDDLYLSENVKTVKIKVCKKVDNL